jgi:Putative polyhydroxyalkanoic acid system protein (PHA_gran_rgn)
MSKPLVVSIPHRLDRDEAVHRLKSGLGSVRANFGHLFRVEEETWSGEHLDFRVRALGQSATGTIDVADDHVVLEVALPWLLAKLAEAAQPLIRKEGTLMLERK